MAKSLYNQKITPSYHKTSFDFSAFSGVGGFSTNEQELKRQINAVMRQAQTNTLNKMLDKLEQFIDEDVYDKHALGNVDNPHYERTGELRNLFHITKVYVSNGIVRGSIDIDYHAPFSHGTSDWVHESVNQTRRNLTKKAQRIYGERTKIKLDKQAYVKLINNGVSSQHSLFGEIIPRPFWTNFLKWANDNYNFIFKLECKKLGIILN